MSGPAPRALTWVGSLRAAHRDMFKVALKGGGHVRADEIDVPCSEKYAEFIAG